MEQTEPLIPSSAHGALSIPGLFSTPWALSAAHLTALQSACDGPFLGRSPEEVARGGDAPGASDGSRYAVVDGVALLDVTGILVKVEPSALGRLLGMRSTRSVRAGLAVALQDPAVHSVVLRVDSPGGTVDGTQELANALFAARVEKPVVSLADGCCCSAAYWVASSAERVFVAGDTTAVGSIGIVATHVDVSMSEAAQGRKTTEITAGKFKRIASQYGPLSDHGRIALQAMVDTLYSVFVGDVARFRGVPQESVLAAMADGRVFLGKRGVQAGLADGMTDLRTLVARLNQERSFWRPEKAPVAASRQRSAHTEFSSWTLQEWQQAIEQRVAQARHQGRHITGAQAAEDIRRIQGASA